VGEAGLPVLITIRKLMTRRGSQEGDFVARTVATTKKTKLTKETQVRGRGPADLPSAFRFVYFVTFVTFVVRNLRAPFPEGSAMPEILFKEESYRIMGACFEVYKEKGSGFVEPVYQECLELELAHQSIPFTAQPQLELSYKGRRLTQVYKPDFVCFGKIIMEIKAVSKLTDEHRAQVHNYLKATGHRLGLLVNFGHHPKLEWERIVR